MINRLYSLNEKYYNKYLNNDELKKFSELWLRDDTIDSWRHERMGFDIATYIFNDDINNKVLTIGDGKYGLDSIRLKNKGVKMVTPSDICEDLLKESKRLKLIDNYHVENAEKITFDDNSYDYVFCKESIHHCPRPYLALYEMLRVAKKGIFLIEPLEKHNSIRSWFKKSFKIDKKRKTIEGFYENSSNFLYMQSLNEYIKLSISLNLPHIAFKKINDHYQYGVECSKFNSYFHYKIKFFIFIKNILSFLKIDNENIICVGIMKKKITDKNKLDFKKIKMKVFDIKPNPYL